MTTKRRHRFTVAFKKRVALEVLRGDRTAREIAVRHQVRPTQVAAWKASGGRRAIRDRGFQ